MISLNNRTMFYSSFAVQCYSIQPLFSSVTLSFGKTTGVFKTGRFTFPSCLEYLTIAP